MFSLRPSRGRSLMMAAIRRRFVCSPSAPTASATSSSRIKLIHVSLLLLAALAATPGGASALSLSDQARTHSLVYPSFALRHLSEAPTTTAAPTTKAEQQQEKKETESTVSSPSSPAPSEEPPAPLNDAAARLAWLHYPAVLLTILSFVLSPCLAVLMFLRRNRYPFIKLNVPFLAFNELLIPFAVWQALLPLSDEGSTLPCWFSLLFWDIPLFPIEFSVLYLVYKLWLDFHFNQDIVRGRLNTKIVRHYNLLRSYRVILPAALLSWGFTWLGVIPRAVRVWEHWGSSLLSDECNNFQPMDAPVDITTSIVFSAGTVFAAIYLLKDVKEAFKMKARAIRAATTICIAFVFVDTIPISHDLIAKENFTVVYGISILSFGFGIHLFTWFISFSAVLASYRYEKDTKEDKPSIHLDNGTVLVRCVGGDKLHQLEHTLQNPSILEEFNLYLVEEFAVNLSGFYQEYLRFKAAKSNVRNQMALDIKNVYLSDNSTLQIQVSEAAQHKALEFIEKISASAPATSPPVPETLFDPIAQEVLLLLCGPFDRFWLRKLCDQLDVTEIGRSTDGLPSDRIGSDSTLTPLSMLDSAKYSIV